MILLKTFAMYRLKMTTLQCLHKGRWSQRRATLNKIAQKLGIDHQAYSTVDALWEKLRNTVKTLGNTTDPVALEDITKIDITHLVFWKQAGCLYGAKIASLKQLFDNGCYMNPYAIDKASGVQSAEDPEAYDNLYNMKKVNGLEQLVKNATAPHVALPTSRSELESYNDAKMRFEVIRCVPDGYITHIVTAMEAMDVLDVYKILHGALGCVIMYIRATETNYEGIDVTCTIAQLRCVLWDSVFGCKTALEFLYKTVSMWKAVLEENVIELAFEIIGENI